MMLEVAERCLLRRRVSAPRLARSGSDFGAVMAVVVPAGVVAFDADAVSLFGLVVRWAHDGAVGGAC